MTTPLPQPASVHIYTNNASYTADQLRQYGADEYKRGLADAAKACNAESEARMSITIQTEEELRLHTMLRKEAELSQRLTSTLRTCTEALKAVTAERDALLAENAAQRVVLDQALEALQSLFSWKVDEQRGKRCIDAITAIQGVLK